MIAVVLFTVLGTLSEAVHAQEDTPAPTTLELMKSDAVHLTEIVESSVARSLLSAVADLPRIETRVVYYNRTTRDALTEADASNRSESALEGYERKELNEHFYYYTKYGTPLAAVRPLEILGNAGFGERDGPSIDGASVVDFGFGSIGQLRLLASLGASVVGVEVDPLLRALYSEEADTGVVARAGCAGDGKPGRVSLLFGQFPADSALVRNVGGGHSVFLSKNTLKRGYIHPAEEVDPRMLVHLGVDDATFVRRMFDVLDPGGLALIYNLCPAPTKEGEQYKPWADGRSPFSRELYDEVGFEVLAFDEDDSPSARELGRTLGWGESMDLEKDLFGIYTLLRRP